MWKGEKEEFQAGEFVWTKAGGLRYVREFKAGMVYVNSPGARGESLLAADRGSLLRFQRCSARSYWIPLVTCRTDRCVRMSSV